MSRSRLLFGHSSLGFDQIQTTRPEPHSSVEGVVGGGGIIYVSNSPLIQFQIIQPEDQLGAKCLWRGMLARQSDFMRRVWLFKWAIRPSCWSITELFTAPGSSQGRRTNHSPSPSESSQHLGLINPQELICVFSAVTHSRLLHPLRSPSNWDTYEPRHESSGGKKQNKRLFYFFLHSLLNSSSSTSSSPKSPRAPRRRRVFGFARRSAPC